MLAIDHLNLHLNLLRRHHNLPLVVAAATAAASRSSSSTVCRHASIFCIYASFSLTCVETSSSFSPSWPVFCPEPVLVNVRFWYLQNGAAAKKDVGSAPAMRSAGRNCALVAPLRSSPGPYRRCSARTHPASSPRTSANMRAAAEDRVPSDVRRDNALATANCIIIAQILLFSLLFSGAVL